jgi:site-specific DNA recombinase
MKNNIKYFLYVRKSQESDERQIQSIDDQVNVMKKKADELWITIVDIFTESMSAKSPWRYRFNEMIERLKNKEAQWIIAWKLDRLSRNPIDSWNIQYLLQTWVIINIITNDKEYTINDSWLIMSVENWMSNQFLLDLSKNVKRWLKSKIEKWWYPWSAPEWYKNNKENNTIIPHKNFEMLQKLWRMMVTWNYSVKQLIDIANNEWWYRTILRKNSWWKKLRTSTMYFIFNNIFYTWNFSRNWNIYPWNYKPMITIEEYEKVQEMLSRKWKVKVKTCKHNFAFTWLIECWECWASVTAWKKKKYIKSTNSEKIYHNYWCTKNKWIPCSQKWISEKDLEKQLEDILSSIEIIPEFKNWAIWIIKSNYNLEQKNILENKERLLKLEKETNKKLSNLIDLLLDWTIEKDIYDIKKNMLDEELLLLKKEIQNNENKKYRIINDVEEIFDFSSKARSIFKLWDNNTKRIIIKNLGLHFELIDWKLDYKLHPWFQTIKNNREYIWIKNNSFAPIEKVINSGLLIPSNSSLPIWQGPLELHQCLSGSESEHSSN